MSVAMTAANKPGLVVTRSSLSYIIDYCQPVDTHIQTHYWIVEEKKNGKKANAIEQVAAEGSSTGSLAFC